jgi:hypothetical protein
MGRRKGKNMGGKKGDEGFVEENTKRRPLKRNQPMCPYMICKSNKAQIWKLSNEVSSESVFFSFIFGFELEI